MDKARTVLGKAVTTVNYLAMSTCLVMCLIVSIDVILRKLSGQAWSIPGSNEFSSYLLIVLCAFSIPTLQVKKGHIWVNMLVDKMQPKLRCIWQGVVNVLEAAAAALIVFGSVKYGVSLLTIGSSTDVLDMPKSPFAFILAFGFFEFFLLLVLDAAISFRDAGRQGENTDAE